MRVRGRRNLDRAMGKEGEKKEIRLKEGVSTFGKSHNYSKDVGQKPRKEPGRSVMAHTEG